MNATLSRHLTLCLGLALAACSPDEEAGGTTPLSTCPIVAAPASPTFTMHVLPALQASCGRESTTCHGPPTGGELPKGKIDFSTGGGRTAADVHADLVNVEPANAPPGFFRVKPDDVALSWLVVKVSENRPGGDGYGERMPLGLPNLCTATTDTLVAWIQQGAPL